ncbi:DUF421 domain-containing protein [Paenibacillus ginsengarvi]|uniref:DUF421 domain-containing protein n=1 Tax=Paenibacillus ginsengarvi TaxID=400777 RepID=A0A3B0C419_9BACL|nr:DUF421 domain-containing protein [Paenibacillus ginsengarvi]RKN79064.1 DUF421 domain-containing protein [Paenibacillus ginsengarvi]
MPIWMQVVVRSVAALAVLFLMTRLLGKKQLSQLNFFHYIVGITIGEVAGFISLEIEGHFMHGVAAMLVWTLIPLAFEWLSMKSKHVRKWFDGEGTVLIKDGKVLEDNLKKAMFTSDELLEELRKKNAFRFADVEFAVLETDGKVSVMLTQENQPLTPKSLGLKMPNEQEPQTVIMDGEIMDEPLATAGLSRGWLAAELDKLGVAQENVYLAQVDGYGELTVDLYDDQIKTPMPSERAVLWATLRKCEADLELFSLATDDAKAKHSYERSVKTLKSIVKQVEPYLTR